jgi:hypothetical protein
LHQATYERFFGLSLLRDRNTEARKGGREGGREGGKEGGHVSMEHQTGRQGKEKPNRLGGKEKGREGGREGGREERREGTHVVFAALEDGMPEHFLHHVLPEKHHFLSEEAELGEERRRGRKRIKGGARGLDWAQITILP